MGNKHRKTDLDKARDELMSHVVRCEVLDAAMEHRMEWLEDTMGFMAERYPQLSDLQLAQLEMMGKQFLRPAIQHGAGNTAANRGEPAQETTEETTEETEEAVEQDAEPTADAAADEVPSPAALDAA